MIVWAEDDWVLRDGVDVPAVLVVVTLGTSSVVWEDATHEGCIRNMRQNFFF